MRDVIARLNELIGRKRSQSAPDTVQRADNLHVVMPDSVDMPLPRAPREEMRVPASINGRDLSTGRL
jgi:hypothetical protein